MGPVPSDLPKIEEAWTSMYGMWPQIKISSPSWQQYMILLIRIPCSHLSNEHYEVGKLKYRQCGRTYVS